MSCRRTLLIGVSTVAMACSANTFAGDIALVPTASTDVHEINGNEISVKSGSLVYLEVRVANWDPDLDGTPKLLAWQVQLDSTGYASGTQGFLAHHAPTCSTDEECQALVHPAALCNNDTYQEDLACTPIFFDRQRPDYVFAGLFDISGVDLSTPDPRFASTAFSGGAVDTGVERYAATIVLEVSSDARGTFTIGYTDKTIMVDDDSNLIDVTLSPARITIIPEPDRFVPKNRYLSIATGTVGQDSAIRVTFADLPAPFDVHNGLSMWVGKPHAVSTNGHSLGPSINGFPDFHVASLQCQTLVADFSAYEIVDVFDRNVVPGGAYDIDVFDNADPPNLISSKTITTNRWGDAAGSFNAKWLFWESPDNRVDIVTDAIAMLDAFRSLSSAPFKTRVDIQPAIPDQRVTIVDVVYVVSAFTGRPYPFEPVALPCAQ